MTTRLNSEQCHIKLHPSQVPEAIERFAFWAKRLSSVPPDVYRETIRSPFGDHREMPVAEFIRREIVGVRIDLAEISRTIGLPYPGKPSPRLVAERHSQDVPDEVVMLAERLEFWSDWLAKADPYVLATVGLKRQITEVCYDVAAISEAMGLPPLGELNIRVGWPEPEMV
jgi:hypothetical protein